MISKVRQRPKFNLGQLNAYKLMFAIKLSMEKRKDKIWAAGLSVFTCNKCNCFQLYIHIYISLWFSGVSLNKAWQTEFLKSYPDLNVDWKSVLSRYNYHFGNLDSIGQNAQPKDLGSSGKYISLIFKVIYIHIVLKVLK